MTFAQVYPANKLISKKHKITCSAYSVDGKLIATGGMNNKIVIWDNETGTKRIELSGLRDFPIAVEFSKSGKILYSAGKDNKISIWDVNTGEKLNVLKGHKGTVRSISISPDDKFLVSGSDDNKIIKWNLQDGQANAIPAHKGGVASVNFNSDGSKIVSGGVDKNIKEWESVSMELIKEFKAHDARLRRVIYSPDKEYIASCGDDKRINIWDASSYELINSIRAHSKWVQTITFSPDSRYLVSGGHDNYLVVLSAATGQIVYNSDKQDYYVLSVAFHPSGKTFASSTLYSDNLNIWDVSELNIESAQLVEKDKEGNVKKESVHKPEIAIIKPEVNLRSKNGSVLVEADVSSEASLKRIEILINDNVVTDYNQSDLDFAQNNYHLKENAFLIEGENKVVVRAKNIAGITESTPVTVIYKPILKPKISWNVMPGSKYAEPNITVDLSLESEELTTIKAFLNEQLVYTMEVELIEGKDRDTINIPVHLRMADNEFKITAENTSGLSELYVNKILFVQPVEKTEKELAQVVAKEPTTVIEQKPREVNFEILKNLKEAKPNPYRFALIIGNEDYHSYQIGLNAESDVDYAVKDANSFKEYAINFLGVPEENIVFKTNARYIEMMRALKKISGVIEMTSGKAEVFFYYAGHGFPDEKTKEPYFVPVDGSGTDLEFSAIKQSLVYKELTKFPAKHVTCFIDACFSGGGRNQGLMAARAVKVKPKEGVLTKNLVVFTASSGDQSSLPYHAKEHGMFTYFLLEKIKESKGNVTYKELSDYLKEKVGINSYMINSKKQVPQVNISPVMEDNWESYKLK